MKCPECCGLKKMLGLFPVYAEHVPQEERQPVIEFDCPRCGATGEVPEAMLVWIQRDKELKAERMKGGEGLRQYCQSRGIDVLVRSNRERGCIDPATPDAPHQWPVECSLETIQ